MQQKLDVYRKRLENVRASYKKIGRQHISQIGRDMIKEMTRDIFDPLWELGEGELDKQLSSTAFCSKHKDMFIFLKPVRPKASQLHVAGACNGWGTVWCRLRAG